ncbi:MAG: hypothetical protein ACRD2Y_16165 [Terriglobales bacterium]
MQRLHVALVAYAVIALAAWLTLSDPRIRGVTLVVLAVFALRTWARAQQRAPGDSG